MDDAVKDMKPTNPEWDLPQDKTFTQTFEAWVKQMGYPVIRLKEVINNGETVTEISQSRYLAYGQGCAK